MRTQTKNSLSTIILIVGIIAATALFFFMKVIDVSDSDTQDQISVDRNQSSIPQINLDTPSGDTLRDHSLEMASRNIVDLLERANNNNPSFQAQNRLHDNERFYYRRGSAIRDKSLQDFLQQMGFEDLFDLKTVAGKRLLTKSDCQNVLSKYQSNVSEGSTTSCDFGFDENEVYQDSNFPFSLNLFELSDTHFYLSVVTEGLGGKTLISKLYKRDTGEVIDIDPNLLGGEEYLSEQKIWFADHSRITFSYDITLDQGNEYAEKTHNKSRKWWIDDAGDRFVVTSFNQEKIVDLGELLFQDHEQHAYVTPQEYFEVNEALSKFALASGVTCEGDDNWRECSVIIRYGDFVDGGLKTSRVYEVPFEPIETMCWQDGNSAFFWDGDYIVTTSGCPVNIELAIFDSNNHEFLYRHGSIKRNYISDINITPYRQEYGDQKGRATNTPYAQINSIVNTFCGKYRWRDRLLLAKNEQAQEFTPVSDLDLIFKNGICFSYETQDYLSYIAQDFCEQTKNYSAFALEGYKDQSADFTKNLSEMCHKVDLHNTYTQECAVQSESEQDAINNFKRVCSSNKQYSCGSVDGRAICATFPIVADQVPTRPSGWFKDLYPTDFCYAPAAPNQSLGWNFAKQETCVVSETT